MSKQKQNTWLGYINTITENPVILEEKEMNGVERIMSINHKFHSFFYYSVPVIYLLDYTTGQYSTFSKSSELVLGHSPKKFLDGGIDFTIDSFHREDLHVFNQQIFPDRLQLLKKVPPSEHQNIIFSCTYRVKSGRGEYINLLQRNSFIKSDEKGNPLLNLGMVININNIKRENPIIQTVERISNDLLSDPPETIFKKSYYLHEEDRLFSRREKEVLGWMADGLTSKEIAAKLFISIETVNLHRKKMLQKSNTPNVAALVAFAMKNGVI